MSNISIHNSEVYVDKHKDYKRDSFLNSTERRTMISA